jgi:hypothetical protein
VQVKAKGARKIGFKEFQAAVAMIAEKKKISVEDLTAKIVAAGGPASNSTKAEACKFHDDKSLYTGASRNFAQVPSRKGAHMMWMGPAGVYKNGGPTNVDGAKDLSGITDRSEADVRGVKV